MFLGVLNTVFLNISIYLPHLELRKRSIRGDSNKYPQHMFLGVVNTVFLNISIYLPHLELRNLSIQIFGVTIVVVISNVDIKRF